MSSLESSLGEEITGVLFRWGAQFGFIETEQKQTIYIHHSEWSDPNPPATNMKVRFVLGKNWKGFQAINCRGEANEVDNDVHVLKPSGDDEESNRQPDQEEIEQAIIAHRRALQDDSCFICFDDSCKPTVSMLCCGQPTHIACMQKWYNTLHGRSGEMACPYCRQRNAEPTVSGHDVATVGHNYHARRNFNQQGPPPPPPPAPPMGRRAPTTRRQVAPLIAELQEAIRTGRRRPSRQELLDRPLRSPSAAAIAEYFHISAGTSVTVTTTTTTIDSSRNTTPTNLAPPSTSISTVAVPSVQPPPPSGSPPPSAAPAAPAAPSSHNNSSSSSNRATSFASVMAELVEAAAVDED
eukprot:CAMPEP_0175031112 /NCGR_PEP_ID=MMETSP0005-20121125/20620_1 /TAXON_ID=420556 /ORGANISM="Ochromonas sp., Strain CCMP1393" /LENGTH=351 /DNA_ID=CAMNT_0016291297 /DNA_START=23 /DNA_END=1078 /DNA_ORIENTATION=-